MDRIETELADEEWALVEPLSPAALGKGRRREPDMRIAINAM
ncbi:MAG: hypothetical protein OXH79_05185 [Boseongicola sp.]|nr:hypothetical protein [Boseongicola sp.]